MRRTIEQQEIIEAHNRAYQIGADLVLNLSPENLNKSSKDKKIEDINLSDFNYVLKIGYEENEVSFRDLSRSMNLIIYYDGDGNAKVLRSRYGEVNFIEGNN